MVICIAASALQLIGCSAPVQVGEPLTNNLAGNDPDAQMEFWHTLYDRKLTSNDEAFHAILLFLDGKDDGPDYAGRVSTLKSRGLLYDSFDGAAHDAVSRGDLAVIIVNALNVRGGLILTIFPHSPRYATRELQYIGIYPPSSTNQTFSGGQFVSIIGRLEDYQRSKGVDAAAAAATDPVEQPAQPDGGNGAAPANE